MSKKNKITKIIGKYGNKMDIKQCEECGKIKIECELSDINDKWVDYKVPSWLSVDKTYCSKCFENLHKKNGNIEEIMDDLQKRGIKSVYLGIGEVSLKFLEIYPKLKFNTIG